MGNIVLVDCTNGISLHQEWEYQQRQNRIHKERMVKFFRKVVRRTTYQRFKIGSKSRGVEDIMTHEVQLTIDDDSACLFEKCRKIIRAVNGGKHPNNAETVRIICTRFLEDAGIDCSKER